MDPARRSGYQKVSGQGIRVSEYQEDGRQEFLNPLLVMRGREKSRFSNKRSIVPSMESSTQKAFLNFAKASSLSRKKHGKILERVTNYLKRSGNGRSPAMDFGFVFSTIPVG